jgi:hypothetical protein
MTLGTRYAGLLTAYNQAKSEFIRYEKSRERLDGNFVCL